MDTLPYIAISAGLSISSIIVAVRLASLHPLSAVKAGALEVCAGAFWLLTSGLGLTTTSLSLKFLIYQMGFFGVVLVPACWLALSLIISGYERWVNRRTILGLSLVPIITLALVFTNEYHGLVYSNVGLNPANPILPLILTPGLLFWSVVVAYPYVLLLVGTIILARRLMLSRRAFRVQVYSLLLACLIPWLLNTLYFFYQAQFRYIEPTPLALTLGALLVLWRTTHWSGIYIAPVAHEVIIDNMSDPVIVLDYEKRVVEMNPMAEKLICRSYSDLVGKPIESVWSEWPRVAKVLYDESTGPKELSFNIGDMNRYYELEDSRLPGFSNEEVNLLITLRDVTERKRIENARQESERLLRLVTDNMLDMVIRCNLEGTFQYVSPSHRMLGYEPKDLVGKSVFELIHPEDQERAINAFLKGVETRSPKRVEFRFKHADGHYVWIESVGNPIFDQNEEVNGAIIGSRDITERKRADEMLRESEERYRSLFENSTDAILLTATDGRIFAANPEACRILQRTEDEIRQVGRSGVVDLSDPRLPVALTERADTGRFRGELNLKRKDGSIFPAEVATNVFKSGNEPQATAMIIRDLTERKRMEHELRESEARVRSLFNRVLDGIYRSTHEGRFVDVNPALAKMFGYSSTQQMLDIPDVKKELYFSPEERGSHLLDTNQEEVKEYRMRRKDGSEIWVEDHGHYIHDEHGSIIFHEGILRDVTERKRMEEEIKRYSEHLEEMVKERTRQLAESEKRFREMANLLPQIIFETDLTGRYTFANHGGLAAGGYTEGDILNGLNAFQTFAEQDRGRALENFGRVVAGLDIGPIEYNALRKDGSMFPILVHTTPIIREGKVVGVRGVAMDITEQKRMEEKLRNSEARFRELANLLPQIIFEIDEKGNYTFVNRSGRAAAGYTEQDILNGLNAAQTFVEEDREKIERSIVRLLKGENLRANEYTALRKDGTTFPVLIHSTPIIREGKPVGVRGVAMDITERKQMEEELLRSRHLAAVGEAAAMVGHDLRNPLQATTTTLYLAKKLLSSGKREERGEALGLLNDLDEQVRYMDKIVSDLQDYARPVDTEPTETNLSALILEVIANAKIPPSVTVSTPVATEDSPKVIVSPVLLKRVLVNLVTNAVQAMPNGGRLTITSRTTQDTAVISVRDTGTGIPAENLPKIFNPFFTTKAQGQGLGLAVCKRLVEAQGGKIAVASEVGKGSTFTVKLQAKCTRKIVG